MGSIDTMLRRQLALFPRAARAVHHGNAVEKCAQGLKRKGIIDTEEDLRLMKP